MPLSLAKKSAHLTTVFFFFDGRNTKFRHATSANKQTDVDDGAVITALNNSGSFQKHFVKCKKKNMKTVFTILGRTALEKKLCPLS